MKKLIITGAVAFFFIGISCTDQKAASESTTTTTTEGSSATGSNNANDTARRTNISIGSGGVNVSTKKGTNVSVDKNGVNVGSKDVKVDVKTGN